MLARYSTNLIKNTFTKNKISIQQVRNANLKFQSDEWTLNLYPFYPQIFKKKGKNIYQISANSTVMAMSFVSKKMDQEVAWQNRKSITFKFKEFGMLLGAHIGSKKQTIIQAQSTMSKIPRTKIISILDNPQSQMVRIKLQSLIEKPRQPDQPRTKQRQWDIVAKFPYTEYRIMHKLFESSLYELSGWKFMMEFQKKQQISRVQNMIYDDNQFDQLLKNN